MPYSYARIASPIKRVRIVSYGVKIVRNKQEGAIIKKSWAGVSTSPTSNNTHTI